MCSNNVTRYCEIKLKDVHECLLCPMCASSASLEDVVLCNNRIAGSWIVSGENTGCCDNVVAIELRRSNGQYYNLRNPGTKVNLRCHAIICFAPFTHLLESSPQ